jgi:programmed cell death 6-interacting protein
VIDTVPPKSELKILDRANMASAKVPPQIANPFEYLGDHKEFGPALFTKLVPFAVHLAVSMYEQKRDLLVNNNIIGELEMLSEGLHSILISLNLPGSLQALEKPLGLPPNLVQHAEEIRQGDALSRLHRGFADIERLRNSDRAVFEEGKALLAAEEEEDNRLRRNHGTARWTRPESRADPNGAKLWNQAAEIEGYLASSTSSDGVVRDKFASIQDLLKLLAGSNRELLDYVPSSRRIEIPETMRSAIGKLRSAYDDVLRLESRRRKRADALREKAKMDDIKTDILAEANRLERTYPTTAIVPTHFSEFFEKRLDRTYESDLEALEKEASEQDRIMTEVQRANQEFEAQKRRMGDKGGKEREEALQTLDNAYHKYKEIVNNIEVGRKFYNDLSKIVAQFRDNARAWINERRKDARSLEE